MACLELVAACLVVHSYFVDDGFALVDGRAAAAVVVYTVAEGLAAGVASVGSEQPVHSGAVLDVVLLVVADSAYYLVQLA